MDKRMNPKTDRHLYRQDNFDYELFGRKVRQGRVWDYLTQEGLAREIGCVRSTISKCERGMAVDPRIMIALCMKFKLNILAFCIHEQ